MKTLILLLAICLSPFVNAQIYLDVQITQQPTAVNTANGIVVAQLMNYAGSDPVTYSWSLMIHGNPTTNVYDSLKHGDIFALTAIVNGDTVANYVGSAEMSGVVSSMNINSSFNSTTNSTCNGAASIQTTALWNSFNSYEVKDLQNNVIASSNDSIFGVNNLCPGLYNINVVNGSKTMSLLIEPITTSNNPTFSAQVYSEVNSIDSCWSLATASILGTTAPYVYSFDNSSFALDSTMDNLCSGMHLLKVVDVNSDTLAMYFPVADSSQFYSAGGQFGSIVDDTIVADFQNCSFDYNTFVDSASIINFNVIDSVSSVWTTEVWQNGVSTVYTDTIVYSVTVTGQNLLVVNIFCPAKAGGNKLVRIEKIVNVSNSPNSILDNDFIFSVYPSPAKNSLNVKHNSSDVSYSIFDISGKSLLNGDLKKNINIEQLNSGIYFIQFRKNNSTSTVRFIKL